MNEIMLPFEILVKNLHCIHHLIAFRSTTEVIINKADLSDFIKDQGVNKFTPWFLLMSQSMLPKWWDNIGDLKPFIDEENIIKY